MVSVMHTATQAVLQLVHYTVKQGHSVVMEPKCPLLRFITPAAILSSLIVLSCLKQYSGKSASEQESETTKASVNLEEIRAEIKAKIEEEAYNKG